MGWIMLNKALDLSRAVVDGNVSRLVTILNRLDPTERINTVTSTSKECYFSPIQLAWLWGREEMINIMLGRMSLSDTLRYENRHL